jgi:tol-pal system protein YbgF
MAPTATPKDEYDLAYGYILRGDFEAAEASFRQFLAAYPTDRLAGNAEYWLGESFYRRGKYRAAADAFLKTYTAHGDSPKAPDSLARLGASLRALDENEAACATFAEFGRKFPRASADLKRQVQAEQKRANC